MICFLIVTFFFYFHVPVLNAQEHLLRMPREITFRIFDQLLADGSTQALQALVRSSEVCKQLSGDAQAYYGVRFQKDVLPRILKRVDGVKQEVSQDFTFLPIKKYDYFGHIAAMRVLSSMSDGRSGTDGVFTAFLLMQYMSHRRYDVNKKVVRYIEAGDVDGPIGCISAFGQFEESSYISKWPLIRACQTRNILLIRLLLQYGFSPNYTHVYKGKKSAKTEKTSVVEAACATNDQEVKLLIQKAQKARYSWLKKKLIKLKQQISAMRGPQ